MKRLLLLSLFVLAIVAITAGTVYGYYFYQKLAYEKRALEARVSALSGIGEAAMRSIMSQKYVNQNLAEDNTNLNEALQSEQSKNEMFDHQIQEISGTVGKLQKLSETPPELLKKYSKVYFLNEHYVPEPLVTIDASYLLDAEADRNEQIFGPVAPFLMRMLHDAEQAEKKLVVASAYRSFGDQSALKTESKGLYGSGANQFSADQGYSEHQLGTTVDLTTPALGALSTKFATAPGGQWLADNAYKYGFILSYPKNNTYYQYEPWHWRFVSVALATKMHETNTRFYDLTQRDIDQYLINIFD
jgi:D-alanyl-D-alanine carboxypeptidase